MYAAVILGVLGFVGAAELGYQLFGLAVYWSGILVFLGIWQTSDIRVFDERDIALERRASLLTLKFAAVIAIFMMSVMVVIDATHVGEVPATIWGGFVGIASLFAVYGLIYAMLRYRR